MLMLMVPLGQNLVGLKVIESKFSSNVRKFNNACLIKAIC